MKPCLKASSVLCSHRKCVAFGAQISEEVHIADEWDRTPTEPTRKLTYQDLLELKEIQRSLPHASQPCDLTGGRQYLSQVPITLVPLLPNQPERCTHLLDTPPSSGTSSPYYSSSSSSSRTSSPPPLHSPTPSLSHTSLESSPHSSPDPNPFLPLLLDDPDPHPLFPSGKNSHSRRKPKTKKFIIVNDIEIEMDDSDSDSDSDLDLEPLTQFKRFEPKRSATPTPPPTPTLEDDLDLIDLPNSALFSKVSLSAPPQRSRDTTRTLHPTPTPPVLSSSEFKPNSPPRFPQPPRPTHLSMSWREIPSPLSPSSSPPKPKLPTMNPQINLHIPMRFKRSGSGSCLSPCSNSGTGATPALSRVRGV